MAESLILFESVINSRWFLRTSIILFLNKIDVFKTKLPKVCFLTIVSSVFSYTVRSHWRDISQSTLAVPISTRRLSTFSGDSCKQIVHASRSIPSTFCAFETSFLAHISDQSNTSNGHDEHSFGIRSGEGNDPTECIEGLGHSVVLFFFLCLFLRFFPFFSSSCSFFRSVVLHSCSLSIGKDSVRDHCRLVDMSIPPLTACISLWIFLSFL